MTFHIELVDAEGELMRAIADPSLNRDDIADDYAYALLCSVQGGGTQEIDWPKVNAAILERYSPGGFRYIKDRAWRKIKAAAP